MEWIYKSDDPILQTLAGCLIIFLLIIVVTRIIGLRSFAKFTAFDFAVTIAIGGIISSTLTSSTSIAQGFTAITGLLFFTLVFAFLQRKFKVVNKVVSNKPQLLMNGSEILYKNLAKTNVQKEQLIAKLREANVLNLKQVKAVVLESTGDISVLHKSTADSDEELDEILLLGVVD